MKPYCSRTLTVLALAAVVALAGCSNATNYAVPIPHGRGPTAAPPSAAAAEAGAQRPGELPDEPKIEITPGHWFSAGASCTFCILHQFPICFANPDQYCAGCIGDCLSNGYSGGVCEVTANTCKCFCNSAVNIDAMEL